MTWATQLQAKIWNITDKAIYLSYPIGSISLTKWPSELKVVLFYRLINLTNISDQMFVTLWSLYYWSDSTMLHKCLQS